MAYDIRKTEEGETIVLPLELPIYDGLNSELGRQAQVYLTSALRHIAVYDWMEENLDTSDDYICETMGEEKAQAAAQLVNVFMSLAGIADNLGIDIMQEIWDMPWKV